MQVQGFSNTSTDWAAITAAGVAPDALEGNAHPAIAGYRLARRIGEGRRSTVWLAYGKQGAVALKLVDRAEGLALAREFQSAAVFAHPNILRVLEQGRAGGIAYLAMEYAAGGTLSEHLGSPLDPSFVLSVARQAALALMRLHAANCVHRDLKPANFLLRADDTVVLADFGLVTAAGSRDATARPGALFGTPRYVAPEQLQGAPAQPSADVYSLGVLLHELLCGRPPFGGETLMEVLSQHLVAAVPPLPPALAALQPLLVAMLAKDAAQRLPDARAVLERIDALAGAFVPPVTPAGTAGKRWNP
jgi:serine/threonine-protein kinase PpkA